MTSLCLVTRLKTFRINHYGGPNSIVRNLCRGLRRSSILFLNARSFYDPCAKWRNPRGIRTPSLDRVVPVPEGTPNRSSRSSRSGVGFSRPLQWSSGGIRTPFHSTRSSVRLVAFRLGPCWSSFVVAPFRPFCRPQS